MQQSKLIELLRRLSPRQMVRAGDFMASPYFNKNKDNLLLFNYLREYAPNFEHENLSQEFVISKIPTEKKLTEKSLSYMMSQLIKLLETFLSIENLLDDSFEMLLFQSNQLHRLGLSKHQKSTVSAIEKWLDNAPLRNADFYHKQLIFKRLQYGYSDPNERGFNEKLQEAADSLDNFYLIEKLRLACQMKNLTNTLKLDYEITHSAEIVGWANIGTSKDNPSVQVYNLLFQLLSDSEKVEQFEQVKQLLLVHSTRFETDELKELYSLLLNYCTGRINRFNDQHFWHQYLDINKLLLDKGLIFEEGHLSPWRYTNLVAVGLRTGQTDWTHDFIHQFKEKLPPAHAENLFLYNLAQFHFHQKDFGKAQKELMHVEFTDVLLNISVRSLLIKIYYETDQEELLLSYLEATRIFLLRNKLLDHRLKAQMNKFVEYCSKLIRAKGDAARWQNLQENLPSAQEILHRDWLAQKLEIG